MSEDTTIEPELNDDNADHISLFSSEMSVDEDDNMEEVEIQEIER